MNTKKLFNKHIKKRKKKFTILILLSLFLFWAQIEDIFSNTTFIVLWIINTALIAGYIGFSTFKFFEDKERIQLANARREKFNK
jgi:hypothetical protein